AISHPFWLLNQSTWTWLTAAGDTIQFADNGPYYMGQHNNSTGRGYTWPAFCAGNDGNCDLPYPWPSGTKMYGVGVGNCHQMDSTLSGAPALESQWAGHGALKNATVLEGI